MISNLLDELIKSVEKQGLQLNNILVRRNGCIIAEHDFVKEKSTLLWSVSKSITSLAVGIAESEGCFKLTDKIVSFFPNESVNGNKLMNEVTIHDLLCMGVGHEVCPIEKAMEANQKIEDISKMFFEEPVVYVPGTVFRYNNTATYMLSMLIAKTSGQCLSDYCRKNIFKPLGIDSPKWDADDTGVTLGFTGLYLTAHELSKIGQLILDDGKYEDKQIVPKEYLYKATHSQISTADFNKFFATNDHKKGYGYQIWMCSYPGSYRMDGLYGQYVVILPDKNTIITYVSNEPKKMMNILELTWSTLIDKL